MADADYTFRRVEISPVSKEFKFFGGNLCFKILKQMDDRPKHVALEIRSNNCPVAIPVDRAGAREFVPKLRKVVSIGRDQLIYPHRKDSECIILTEWDDGSVTGVGYLFSEPSVEYFEPAQEEEAKLSPEQKDEIRRLNTPGLKFFVGKLTHEGHLMDTLRLQDYVELDDKSVLNTLENVGIDQNIHFQVNRYFCENAVSWARQTGFNRILLKILVDTSLEFLLIRESGPAATATGTDDSESTVTTVREFMEEERYKDAAWQNVFADLDKTGFNVEQAKAQFEALFNFKESDIKIKQVYDWTIFEACCKWLEYKSGNYAIPTPARVKLLREIQRAGFGGIDWECDGAGAGVSDKRPASSSSSGSEDEYGYGFKRTRSWDEFCTYWQDLRDPGCNLPSPLQE